MNLSNRLTQLRKSRDLTQHELADILNIGKSTIAMYETGKREPNSETLIVIAEYFGVTIDYLLRGEVKNEEDEIQSETKAFLERINKLGERERSFLKGKVEDMIKILEQMKNI